MVKKKKGALRQVARDVAGPLRVIKKPKKK